jgi:hypothetical protein
MPAADMTTATATASPAVRKTGSAPEKKYKCQFCNRAFSRSEHRSRHERSREYLPVCSAMEVAWRRARRYLLMRHARRESALRGRCPQ